MNANKERFMENGCQKGLTDRGKGNIIMTEKFPEIYIKITMDYGNGIVFDDTLADLLLALKEQGSINSAAKQIGISYTKAWKIITAAEEIFGCKFTMRQRPQGTVLTDEGNGFLDKYAKAVKAAADAAKKKLF